MLRLACFLLIAATMVGALMPTHKPSAPASPQDGITYTPQATGASYRVADSSGGDDGPRITSNGLGALKLEREADGHFYTDARVNGGIVHFLVDTGATGVALSRNDARTAGLALDRGRDHVGEGASGAVMGQWVKLDRLEVGSHALSNIPAVVMEDGDQSLLGQDVLRGFDIDVRGDEMVLR